MTFIADTDPFDILGGAAPQTLACRLRVRNVADDADLFIVSTVPGDDLPYLAGLPTGDGQEFNPLDGTASIGAYQVEVVDAPDGSSYAVTQYLTDANGFQQLPSVRAFLEFSTDGGATWTAAVIPGFVNSYKLVTANRWSFTIGDSRRADQIAKVFASTTAQTGLASVFNRVTMMIGGPIRQQNGVTDFAGVRDYGGWIFKVINVLGPFVTGGDLLVALEFEAGVMPGVLGLPFYAPTTRGLGGITTFARNRANQLAAGAISQAGWNAELGQFVLAPIPDVTVEVLNLDGTVRQAALTAMVMPTGDQTNPWGIIYPQSGPSPVTAAHGDGIGVTWPAADAPSVGDKFVLYAWRNTIDESNPLHIIGHPVDIVTALWDEVGIAYDATAAAAVKQELGADAQLTLRITQAYVLKDFLEQAIFGPLGLQARIGDSGERVLFTTRIISENIPATTVTLDDLRDPAPPIFAVDEQSIVNLVTTKTKVFQAWNAAMPVARPPDDVATFERIRQFDNGDPGTLGPREQVYEVPGTIAPFGTGQQPDDRYDFALAHGILDRFGRGGLYTELKTTPDIDLALGEEFVLDVPHLPNLNVRGGDRILQVVRKTVVPGSGFDYLCLDSGTTAQFTTGPTFTVAANADDPKRRVDLTITNAATLNAAGASVRVEWAFGASSPTDAGQLAAIYGPLSDGGVVPTDPVTLPRVDAGSTVWVRLRSMIPGQRPSAFTSWSSVDLTDLTAPSSVTYTPDGSDGALIVVTFTPGDTDVPVELWARPDGTGADEERLVLTIPAAATQGQFTIDAGTWIFDLRHHETAPYNGQSADDEQTVVVTATLTLPAPVDPNGYSTTGSPGDTGYDPTTGLYHPIVADDPSTVGTAPTVGLAVRGTIFPSSTEFWMASETAPGSGTPGSYAQVGTVASVQGDWTALTVAVINDGLKRYLKARHVRDGATDSAFTSAVECDPSATVALLPFGTIAPGAADTVPVSDGVIATYQKITNAQIDNAAAIAWSKISKVGSSLADLATRSASDLSSGNLPYAQLPTGGGTWANGGALSITGGAVTVPDLIASNTLTVTGPSTASLYFGVTNETVNLAVRRVVSSAGGGNFIGEKARGTVGAETFVNGSDVIARFAGRPWDGTGYGKSSAEWVVESVENQNVAALGGRMRLQIIPAGSVGETDQLNFISGSVTPASGFLGSYSLGSSVLPFGPLHAGETSLVTVAGATIHLQRAKNTIASPSQPVSGDTLGSIAYEGWDGTSAYAEQANIVVQAAENWSGTTNMGTQLLFGVTPNASGATVVVPWVITNDGMFTPLAASTNTYDIGRSNARVRSGYFGTSVVTPLVGTITAADLGLRYNSTTIGVVTSTGLNPGANDTYTLGVAGTGWQKLRIQHNASRAVGVELVQTATGAQSPRLMFENTTDWPGHGTAMFNTASDQMSFRTGVTAGTSSGTERWLYDTTAIFANGSNVYDLGKSGTTFRTGYFGTSLIVGPNTPASGAMFVVEGTAANLDIYRYANRPASNLYRVNGSVGSPSAVALNDTIFAFQGGGYDGSTYPNVGAAVVGFAAENWNSGAHGAGLTFNSTTAGTTTTTARWRLQDAGHWAAVTDNTYDIGNAGALRPRTGYFGTSVITPLLSATTRVTAPLLGTTTATDVVIDRNSVTQLTLGSLVATFAGDVKIPTAKGYYVNALQVVSDRDTGWTAQTATPSKADLGATPTVGALASWAAAVQAALTTHGLIGA